MAIYLTNGRKHPRNQGDPARFPGQSLFSIVNGFGRVPFDSIALEFGILMAKALYYLWIL